MSGGKQRRVLGVRRIDLGGGVGLGVVTVTVLLVGLALLAQMYLEDGVREELRGYARTPERLGCLVGSYEARTGTWRVTAVTDVKQERRSGAVAPREPCPEGAVGHVHSHVPAERCWFVFPGTQVLTADGESFRRAGYPIGAIVCGARLVWIGEDLVEREQAL